LNKKFRSIETYIYIRNIVGYGNKEQWQKLEIQVNLD
jgi:hypothetical protein